MLPQAFYPNLLLKMPIFFGKQIDKPFPADLASKRSPRLYPSFYLYIRKFAHAQ